MRRRSVPLSMLISLGTLVAVSACGNERCERICAAAVEYQPGEYCETSNCEGPGCRQPIVDKCVDRCDDEASDADLDFAEDACTRHDSSTCQESLCCLGFYYSDQDDRC
jgi:hypothetical protein